MLTIQQLCDRYSLSSKKSLYSRREKLGIEFKKDENGKSYADEQMVELFDDLDNHLKNGGSLKNYAPPVTPEVEVKTEIMPQEVTSEEALLGVIEKLIEKFNTPDPIAYNSSLERARVSGWILSTSEVEQLIGVRPKGDRFTRGCWIFSRSEKIGREAGWKVLKISSNSLVQGKEE